MFDGTEVPPPFAATATVYTRKQNVPPAAGSGALEVVVAAPATLSEPTTDKKALDAAHSTFVLAMSAATSGEPSEKDVGLVQVKVAAQTGAAAKNK